MAGERPWNVVSVVPGEPDRRHRIAGRKVVTDRKAEGTSLVMDRWPRSLDADRIAEIERPEWQVHKMAPHITERTLPEIPPPPPLSGMVAAGHKGPHRCRTEPEIPGECLRYLLALGRLCGATPRFTDPDVNLADIANHTRTDHFDHAAIIFSGVDLCAELGRHSLLSRKAGQQPRFGDRV